MDVEVRYISGCASLVTARERLTRALEYIGSPEVSVRYRLVATEAEAETLQLTGSPTILINGADCFPERDCSVAMSCRLYLTTDGLSGCPTTDQLVAALTPHERSRRAR